MSNQQRYDNAVICLAAHGYDVFPDAQGYLVCDRRNLGDVSLARHLDDLVDLAELIEWAAVRCVNREHAAT